MNKHGLYSKAAQIVRGLQQERGTAEQMVAAAKRLGLKDAELQNAGPLPTGKVTREQLAKHFEDKMPKMYVSQYGENPSYMPPGSGKRFMDLQVRSFKSDNPLSPEEERELSQMRMRHGAEPNVITEPNYDNEEEEGDPSDPYYSNYAIPGGKNYRERLLTLGTEKGKPRYNSSHWTDHDNVLAHIRMSDRIVGEDRESIRPIMEKLAAMANAGIRDLSSGAVHSGLRNGVITPQEAASVSRTMGWYTGHENKPGIGKRLLHVEELQSDWGQEGRDQGFNTGEATKAYQDHIADLKDRFRQKLSWMGDDAAVDKRMGDTLVSEMAYALGEGDKHKELGKAAADERGKAPIAPYVQNTQHWTDLALKNVLREAALGNYEGVVFTPGQAQADRYGLEKQLDTLTYHPKEKRLTGYKDESNAFQKDGIEPEDLSSHVGREVAERLLNPQSARNAGTDDQIHVLQGNDLKAGGLGMKGYYDNIVPKSVMALAKQHDPDIKPGEPIDLRSDDGEYQGFHLPMTDKLKDSVLEKGFSAFKRGGTV